VRCAIGQIIRWLGSRSATSDELRLPSDAQPLLDGGT
jgi:hypothetical protein